ncbi:HAD superfamily protein [alpha proteobacterium U9-1i]|nr:HAD superfamily protein [alpha proteobacterium U9-1i]
MTQILDRLESLDSQYDAVFCDVWGVIHNGRRIFPDAALALKRWREAGKHVVLLTNIPKPRGPIPAQLDRLGYPRAGWDVIVTSGDAIRSELAARAPGPMYKIGPPEDSALWEGLSLQFAPLEQARFIGISGLNDWHEQLEVYDGVLAAAKARDLEMLSANPDIVVRVGEDLVWCAGAVAQRYAALGGRVVMAGKPHPPIYALAQKELETLAGRTIDKSRILAIGDGATTDVKGANDQGLDVLFIANGVHGEALTSNGVLDSAKVDAALAAEGVRANYVMRDLA